MELRRICVFCGSSPGNDPAYAEAAVATGRVLAERGIELVYGGGSVGLMGLMATAALDAGGVVTGVIPDFLNTVELAKLDVTHLEITRSMHERKARMAELSDGFLALPGGLGTLEEVFEAMTWTQLGVHDKPVGFVDVAGFWVPALALLDRATSDGFVAPESRASIVVATTAGDALDAFGTWRRPGPARPPVPDVTL